MCVYRLAGKWSPEHKFKCLLTNSTLLRQSLSLFVTEHSRLAGQDSPYLCIPSRHRTPGFQIPASAAGLQWDLETLIQVLVLHGKHFTH